MVREAKEGWKMDLALKIRNSEDKSKKLWNHINRLSGKIREDEDIEIYEDKENWKRIKE